MVAVNQKINVLITQPHDSLRDAFLILSAARINVYPCPTIDISNASKTSQLDAMLRKLYSCSYIIFTSQIAVIKTIEYLDNLNICLKQLKHIYVCAVGPGTAHALSSHGITTHIIPKTCTARALLDNFPTPKTRSSKVLFPRANVASTLLIEELTRKGYEVISPILYITDPHTQIDPGAKDVIDSGRAHCIAFTSPSSVRAFKQILGNEKFYQFIKHVEVAAIGPTTSNACTDASISVSIQPTHNTLQSLSHGIVHYFNRKSRNL